jgi:hypothetical protein
VSSNERDPAVDALLRAAVEQLKGEVIHVDPLMRPATAFSSPALMMRDFRIELGRKVTEKLDEVLERGWKAAPKTTQRTREVRHVMPKRQGDAPQAIESADPVVYGLGTPAHDSAYVQAVEAWRRKRNESVTKA